MRGRLSRLAAPPGQVIAGIIVAVITGFLVLYPIFYLLQAALDVGDPETRPPTAYGLDNFEALGRYTGAGGAKAGIAMTALGVLLTMAIIAVGG